MFEQTSWAIFLHFGCFGDSYGFAPHAFFLIEAAPVQARCKFQLARHFVFETVLGCSWVPLGANLGTLGLLLSRTWGLLGASWADFGASWAQLGSSWAQLGASWGRFALILRALGSNLGLFGLIFGFLGPNLGFLCLIWGILGPFFLGSWAHLGALSEFSGHFRP